MLEEALNSPQGDATSWQELGEAPLPRRALNQLLNTQEKRLSKDLAQDQYIGTNGHELFWQRDVHSKSWML